MISDQDAASIARKLINNADILDEASIIKSSADQDSGVLVQTYALDTAVLASNPIIVPQFQSVYVSSATDQNVSVSLALSNRSLEGMNNAVPLTQNAGVGLPRPISGGYLFWSAQSGKTITLMFLKRGIFQSGKLVSVNSGGITISEGSAIATRTVASLPSITSTRGIILPALATRIAETLYNGDSFNYYLGDVTVTVPSGASPGIPLLPGQSMIWKNTAALYAITDGSTIALASRNLES